MKQEKSCGIIPFYLTNNKLHVLLVKQNNGVIGFPKGHVENNETEIETALRECKEETSLDVFQLNNFRTSISYYIPELDVMKEVVFFIGNIVKYEVKKQESEINDIFLVPINEAYDLISYEDTKEVLRQAIEYINRKIK